LTLRAPGTRALRERRTVHIPDRSDPAFRATYPDAAGPDNPEATLSVPLLHEREAIGFLTLIRSVARGYSEPEIALIESFADQAAIAIANARLFEELEQRTTDLTRALEQQTALGDVLRVIAS